MAIYKGTQLIAGAGKSPIVTIDDSTKHLVIDGTDTDVKVQGDLVTIDSNGYICINGVSTNVRAKGDIVTIDSNGYICVNGAATTTKVVTDYNDLSNKPMVNNVVTALSDTNTKQVRNITVSTATPSSSDGNNGDIWVVYS